MGVVLLSLEIYVPSLTVLAGTLQSVSCLQALWTDPQTDRRTGRRRPRHTIVGPDKSGIMKSSIPNFDLELSPHEQMSNLLKPDIGKRVFLICTEAG